MIFRIASGLVKEMHRLAATGAPDEVCGLLLGRAGDILALREARNVAADRKRRFEIDPAVLLATHREVRGLGMAVIGHYHSHPHGSTVPSARDAARALENGQLWLIIACAKIEGWMAVSGHADAVHGRFIPVVIEAQ